MIYTIIKNTKDFHSENAAKALVLNWTDDNGGFFTVDNLNDEVLDKYPLEWIGQKPNVSYFKYFRIGDLYLAEALLERSLYLNALSQSNSKGPKRSDSDAKKSSLIKKLDLE